MKKYSVTIAGRHSTSFSLEEEFYAQLKKIAELRKISINELITQIDSQRTSDNLSAAIRIYVLQFLQAELSAAKKL